MKSMEFLKNSKDILVNLYWEFPTPYTLSLSRILTFKEILTLAMLNSPFNISVTSEASMVPPPSLNVKIKCDVSGVTWGVTCQTRWKSTEFCLPESSACRMVCKGYDKLYLHHWQGQGHYVRFTIPTGILRTRTFFRSSKTSVAKGDTA